MNRKVLVSPFLLSAATAALAVTPRTGYSPPRGLLADQMLNANLHAGRVYHLGRENDADDGQSKHPGISGMGYDVDVKRLIGGLHIQRAAATDNAKPDTGGDTDDSDLAGNVGRITGYAVVVGVSGRPLVSWHSPATAADDQHAS